MGYNGKNRGRTHNWSGVGDKRYYNWGLNLTAKAMVAPFAILATLAKMDTRTSTSSYAEEPVVSFSNGNSSPSELIRAMEDKNDELHVLYRNILFIKRDIKNIKWNIRLLGFDVFHWKRNSRTRKLLRYVIERRKRLVKQIELSDYNVGSPIKPAALLGRIAIHDTSQHNNGTFSLGCLCKIESRVFHKDISHERTFSISTSCWQMLFFENAVFIEDRKGFVILPYNLFKTSYLQIYNGRLSQTYGYHVAGTSWYHSRIDGGPDRRFKENFQLYTIIRHQVEIKITGYNKPLYFILETTYDYKALFKILNKRYNYDPYSKSNLKK